MSTLERAEDHSGMNVALTGFMGAGKTTTARRLARLLQMAFVDTDAEIERIHGPISQIFASQGEAVFRRYEAAVIEALSQAGPHVIAVGGGAVLEEENRRHLRESGLVVHLAISPYLAWRRVARRSHRPLLGTRPDLATVTALLDARAAAYADCDLSIRVDHRSPLTVARIIARWYEDLGIGKIASR